MEIFANQTEPAWLRRKGWQADDRLSSTEIPVDPAMPLLPKLLDASIASDLIKPVIGRKSPEGAQTVEKCSIVSVAYRPGRECRVSYAIETVRESDGAQQAHLIYAKTVSKKRAPRIVSERTRFAAQKGLTFECLDDQTLAAPYPNDLRLHGLQRLANGEQFSAMVNRALDNREPNFRSKFRGCVDPAVVSYRPERHCLFNFRFANSSEGSPNPESAFARVYRDGRAKKVLSVMRSLWESDLRKSGILDVAKPLGIDLETLSLIQSAVPGRPAGDANVLRSSSTLIANIGLALAALHSHGLDQSIKLDTKSTAQQLTWLEKNARGLKRVFPELGQKLAAIIEILQHSPPDSSSKNTCLIHGDFSMNQLLVQRDGIAIIDFDDACYGNSCADLGSFLARIRPSCETDSEFNNLKSTLISSYQSHANTRLDEGELQWFYALSLARLALSKLAHLQPNWREKVSNLFDASLDALRK